jgi:RNA polymerase sigma factor (sigma-70 family)
MRINTARADEIMTARNINRACADLRRLVGAPRGSQNETICRLAAEQVGAGVGPQSALGLRIAAARAVVAAETDKLVVPNLRLAERLARRYRSQGPDFSDLIEEANLGLMGAAVSFKPHFRNTFETYAARRVKKALARSVNGCGEQAGFFLSASSWIGGVRGEPSDPEQSLINRERLERSERKGRKLTPRELESLYLRIVRNMRLDEVAEQFNVAVERVRQIQNAALGKLQAPELPVLREIKAKPGPAALTLQEIENLFAVQSEEVRDIVMYLARKLLPGLYLHELGRYFLIRPTAALAGIRTITARYHRDVAFRSFIDEIIARLGQSGEGLSTKW